MGMYGEVEDGIDCQAAVEAGEEVRTKQEFADDADVNKIVARCLRTGTDIFSLGQRVAPVFADVSELGDWRDMLEKVQNAQDAFMELPIETRKRFQNDPGQLLAFISDVKNREEAIKLGLVVAPAVPPAVPPVVEPPKAAS